MRLQRAECPSSPEEDELVKKRETVRGDSELAVQAGRWDALVRSVVSLEGPRGEQRALQTRRRRVVEGGSVESVASRRCRLSRSKHAQVRDCGAERKDAEGDRKERKKRGKEVRLNGTTPRDGTNVKN